MTPVSPNHSHTPPLSAKLASNHPVVANHPRLIDFEPNSIQLPDWYLLRCSSCDLTTHSVCYRSGGRWVRTNSYDGAFDDDHDEFVQGEVYKMETAGAKLIWARITPTIPITPTNHLQSSSPLTSAAGNGNVCIATFETALCATISII
jgi:hypothetical protein